MRAGTASGSRPAGSRRKNLRCPGAGRQMERPVNITQTQSKKRSFRVLAVAIFLALAAGCLLTGYLGRVAEKGFRETVNRDVLLTSSLLHDNLGDVENAAKSLGFSDAAVAALASGSHADLEHANALLDRVNGIFDMSICYLMDRNGLVLAASNRKEKSGFVGKNFGFRPYFKGALSGRLTRYFALGTTTGERGYFAATPVLDGHGAVTGAVVVKRNVAPFAVFLKKYTNAFLVSPEGIIFISGRSELNSRSLWPIGARQRSELQASHQFGHLSFAPLLAREPRSGSYVRLDNKQLYLQRIPFGTEGWTLVFMTEPLIVANYRWFGILLTAVFVLLLLFFGTLLRSKDTMLEASKELLKSKDDWKRTFDTVPDLIAIIAPDGRILSVNRAMSRRLGITGEDAAGRLYCELLHGSPQPPPSCPLQRMLVSGKTESEAMSGELLNGDFIVTAAPILNEDGTIESAVQVMHDVSVLKQMEQSLKEYAQRMELVLEGSNDATWEWDMITNLGVHNERYYEMLEYRPEEVHSDYDFFLKTIHPEDVSQVQASLQGIMAGRTDKYEAQYRMVTKSGKLRLVMGRGKVVRFEGGRPAKMAGVITDITQMKRLSEEANRISNLASIGLLAGGLAHDFNNVLNVIYGNVNFARMLAGDDPAVAEPLADAEEACERAQELGNRLQALAQENAPVREPVALAAIIEEIAETLFEGSDILHRVSAPDDISGLEADPRQIRQVFENLLTNAKDAQAGGGSVVISLENFTVDGQEGLPLPTGQYVRIAVQDSGIGIPEQQLPRIFDPYFSTKDTYSQRGMGMGLAICNAVLKRHRGHIGVESEVGVGTRFSVYLPALLPIAGRTPEGEIAT